MRTSQSKKQASQVGIGLVEVLIGAAIVALTLSFTVATVNHFFAVGTKTADRVAAAYLAQEGVEALRFVRDGSWATIAALPEDTPRYLDIDSDAIGITSTPEVIDGFERTVFVRDVYRATAGDDIVDEASEVGKALDPNTKLVEVSVYAPATGVTVTLGAYLTNLWTE